MEDTENKQEVDDLQKSEATNDERPYWMEGADEEIFSLGELADEDEDWQKYDADDFDGEQYWMEGVGEEISVQSEVDKADKSGWGVACALFTGFAGLVFGCMLYEDREKERKSFVKGFWVTTAIFYVLVLFVAILVIAI